MRFLGNKTRLLDKIEFVIKKYGIEGDVFCDLFSGTSSVGDFFKDKYQIIANDYLYSLSHIARAKLSFDDVPKFEKFVAVYSCSPFDYLNSKEYEYDKQYFITKNYSPKGGRQFFTKQNAIKIDGMRLDIEEFYKNKLINEEEYSFLLASLVETIMGVSNTTGTYEAYLKKWDNRAFKDFVIMPLEFECKKRKSKNIIYNEDSNELLRKISGDILYIDPPYTVTDYNSAYHLLESVCKYDYPEIRGITGRRVPRNKKSRYHKENSAYKNFEDLFRQANFKHILISYSSQGLVPVEDLVELASRFAKDNIVHLEEFNFREYKNIQESKKRQNGRLREVIIYFEKDSEIIKSPLNYTGSKDTIINDIQKNLPKHISTFVDAMGGAFNVGANIVAMDKVVYNEFLPHVYKIIKKTLDEDKDKLIKEIEKRIFENNLEKANKETYIEFRKKYNSSGDIIDLFILQMYCFQNQMRFNSKMEFNTPVGNCSYNDSTKERIKKFIPKTKKIIGENKDVFDMEFTKYDKDTLFYFDPPYFITRATYNDGKRGFVGWSSNEETKLLELLDNINKNGYKFMLSNVIYHNGETNHLLLEWVKTNNFTIVDIGRVGSKNKRKEVIILNYDWSE